MKKTLSLLLAFLALSGFADDHVYSGHYASGLSKWTVKGTHVYEGHYASGLAKWTTGESSGLLHVYSGHYASGLSKWTYKDGHLYEGHYASGLAKWTYKDGHIYEGHYASGLAKFTFKNNHLYKGHYASGISAWTFGSTADVTDGLLVFLATQVLEPADAGEGTGTGGTASGGGGGIVLPPSWGAAGGTGGAEEDPPTAPVLPPADPVLPSEEAAPPSWERPEPPAAAPSPVWNKARVLRGVYWENGVVVAVAEVKCGKLDRKGLSKISVVIKPFIGKKMSFRAQKVNVGAGVVEAAWTTDALGLEIAGTDFVGRLGAQGELASMTLGGLSAGTHLLHVSPEGPRGDLPGHELDLSALPSGLPFSTDGGRCTFAKGAPSKARLSYKSATGLFKGAFKAAYAPQGAAAGTRPRLVTVKISGVVVDGVGVGAASSVRPAQAYSVFVE